MPSPATTMACRSDCASAGDERCVHVSSRGSRGWTVLGVQPALRQHSMHNGCETPPFAGPDDSYACESRSWPSTRLDAVISPVIEVFDRVAD